MKSLQKVIGSGHRGLLLLAVAIGIPLVSAQAEQPPRAEILTSTRHAVTPPLRDFVPSLHAKPQAPFRVFPIRHPVPVPGPNKPPGGGPPGGNGGGHGGGGGSSWTDPDLVSPINAVEGAAGSVFQGISANSVNQFVPPDPNLSVGATQIVQTTNVEYAVWNKPAFGNSATQALAPAPIHTIFSSLSGSLCATVDGGDPIVLWDHFDQRWIISQLAYNSRLSDDHWCVAISNSSDATGSYSIYDFDFGSNFPDYPKVGIWNAGASSPNSGVYLSVNIFARGNRFTGAEACAFPLSDVAAPPSNITLVCNQAGTSVYSVLPADVDGSNPAPNAGDLYLQFNSSSGVGSSLSLYRYTPDFQTPSQSTFSLVKNISVGSFHEACGGGTCVPQLGTTQQLDSLGDRLMYRLAYRNHGNGTDSLFVNHSVQVSSSSNQTGVRWYKIDNPAGSTSVVEGTYAPGSLYRWMGSIAQDQFGDIGLAYSTSSSSQFPGLAFTGRTPSDSPANALDQESMIFSGNGSQTGVSRWGDYSSTVIDPSDDCTFWYTNEYEPATGSFNWSTIIASFRFPSCTQ